MERPRAEYVHQRQYGIIAPGKDPERVGRLVTSGLYTCFAVALHDADANVGIFTHLDYIEDLSLITRLSLPVLGTLGARRLTLETINVDSWQFNNYGREEIVCLRKSKLDRLTGDLIRHNLAANSGWVDRGSSFAAIFDAGRGLIPVRTKQLGLTRTQIEALHQYRAKLTEVPLQNQGYTRAIPITCAYKPEIT